MSRCSRGFTLMEMIGVMAVLAILASALAPSIFEAIDRAYAEAEDGTLVELGDNLINHVLENKTIPSQNPNSWVPVISNYGDLRDQDVEINAKGFRRRLYVDPRFFSTSDSAFPGYTQNVGLSAAPNSPRLMLISNLKGNVPGPTNSSSDFDAVWEQLPGAPVVEDSDMKIQRVNLRPYFHRVLLVNSNPQQPSYSLETQALRPVPGSVGGVDSVLTRYVLRDTELRLFAPPYPGGSVTTSTLVKGEVGVRYSSDGTNWFWESL